MIFYDDRLSSDLFISPEGVPKLRSLTSYRLSLATRPLSTESPERISGETTNRRLWPFFLAWIRCLILKLWINFSINLLSCGNVTHKKLPRNCRDGPQQVRQQVKSNAHLQVVGPLSILLLWATKPITTFQRSGIFKAIFCVESLSVGLGTFFGQLLVANRKSIYDILGAWMGTYLVPLPDQNQTVWIGNG